MKAQFNRVVDWLIHALGTPEALAASTLIVVIWAVTGPLFGFSDTWQLVINTGTTVVTFLMVFVIQNAQNRDAKAVHIKLDELIRAVEGARNRLVTAEKLPEEEQDQEIARLIKVAVAEAHAKSPKSAPARAGQRRRPKSSSAHESG